MAENEDLPPLPAATSVPRTGLRLSAVWIIPIIAALMGGWIVLQKVLSEGPAIEVSFASAEGLEAGKTTVKYNGLDVGVIKSLTVSADHERILASVQMAPATRDWLVEGTSFWVVRPRIAGGSITGLGTLLSGSYVGMAIGSGSDSRRSFTASEVPPVVAATTPGRFFRLKAANLGSLDYGAPIYFRRIQVGQLTAYGLDDDGRELTLTIFVKAPYDRFVKPETRFWQASGLDFSIDANGLNVQTQSLLSVLIGGIAFDTPVAGETADRAPAETTFELFADEKLAMKAPERDAQRFVLYFDEAVRGLSAGAPLTFLGLPIGEVLSVRLDAGERRKLQVRARVLIAVYPRRFLDILADPQALNAGKPLTPAARRDFAERLVARGLRAHLRTANLLTGQLYIALDYAAEPARAKIDWAATPPVFPVARGRLTDLEEKATSILTKVDQLPLKAIGRDLQRSLATLAQTLDEANLLVKRWGGELTPELGRAVGDARRTFAAAERTLTAAERTVAPDSALVGEMHATLSEVQRALQSIRALTDYLERHPEALIRGKNEE
jgi:paraquat-inducible protein B